MGYDSYNGCLLPKDLPSAAYAGSPYGFFRMGPEEHLELLDDARTVLSLICGEITNSGRSQPSSAIQGVRQALWRVATTDNPDWFTLFGGFGCPPYESCREFIRTLGDLRRHLREGDIQGCSRAMGRFRAAGGEQALLRLVADADCLEEATPMAFILWCHEDEGRLVIGSTDRPLVRLASEVGQSRGGRVYGVVGAWTIDRVSLPMTRAAIEARLARWATPDGSYDLPLSDARSKTGSVVAAAKQPPNVV